MRGKPVIRQLETGSILTDTPWDQDWVNEIKAAVPAMARKWHSSDRVWIFDQRYYECVKTLIEAHFGSAIDSVTNPGPQFKGWREKWEAFTTGPKSLHTPSKSGRHVLFVTDHAPPEVVTAAYRALAKKHHPDNGGDEDAFKLVHSAYVDLKRQGQAI